MSRISVANEQSLAPVARQASIDIAVDTDGPGFTDITPTIGDWIARERLTDGLLTLFVRHTSAAVTIQENADPNVHLDLADAFEELAPRRPGRRHVEEGPDDMPAHIKAVLTDTAISIPIRGGRMILGTWQSVYLLEFRDAPRHRIVTAHYLGS